MLGEVTHEALVHLDGQPAARTHALEELAVLRDDGSQARLGDAAVGAVGFGSSEKFSLEVHGPHYEVIVPQFQAEYAGLFPNADATDSR